MLGEQNETGIRKGQSNVYSKLTKEEKTLFSIDGLEFTAAYLVTLDTCKQEERYQNNNMVRQNVRLSFATLSGLHHGCVLSTVVGQTI